MNKTYRYIFKRKKRFVQSSTKIPENPVLKTCKNVRELYTDDFRPQQFTHRVILFQAGKKILHTGDTESLDVCRQ